MLKFGLQQDLGRVKGDHFRAYILFSSPLVLKILCTFCFPSFQSFSCEFHQCPFIISVSFSSITRKATQALASNTPGACEQISSFLPTSLPPVFSQTGEERQQALQAFTAQSFLGSSQHTIPGSGTGPSAHAFPSPASSSERKTKMKRGPRKNHNKKYRLKYLRLRKTARAMIFVSNILIENLWFPLTSLHMSFNIVNSDCYPQENAALCDEVAHLEEKFLRAKEERRSVEGFKLVISIV